MNTFPENLEEAIDTLKGFLVYNEKQLKDISQMDEEEFLTSSHFRTGMFIRNSWNLWWFENHNYTSWPKEKPKLVDFFNKLDIYHADDMSSIILTSLYRTLSNKDIKLEKQIKEYKDFWKMQGFEDGIPKHTNK